MAKRKSNPLMVMTYEELVDSGELPKILMDRIEPEKSYRYMSFPRSTVFSIIAQALMDNKMFPNMKRLSTVTATHYHYLYELE